jgi:glucuronoxylan 4-O-methyltransferase
MKKIINKIKNTFKSRNKDFNYKKFIQVMKKKNKGLMSKKQYMVVAQELSQITPCDLLVFGLGEDSYLWNGINKGGTTVFLEDSKEWINEVNDGTLDVHQVTYNTLIENHKDVEFDEIKLTLTLPEEVEKIKWDFIIVDAPLGHQPPGRPFKGPGRMSSIYSANNLLKPGGIVVVDDMGREIERKYAYHYFGENNLITLIENKVGIFYKDKK